MEFRLSVDKRSLPKGKIEMHNKQLKVTHERDMEITTKYAKAWLKEKRSPPSRK